MPKGDKSNYKIYVHINKSNGKLYIGQTCMKLGYRWRNGEGYAGTNKIYNAIKKYTWNGFKHLLLFEGLNIDQANIVEEELIKKYKTNFDEHGYNLLPGGRNRTPSRETREKIRRSMIGMKHGDVTKEKHRKAMRLRIVSGEFKGNHSKNTNELYKYNLLRGKPVCQYEIFTLKLINTYISQREAERNTGIPQGDISKCCRHHKCKSAGGFIWCFLGDTPNQYDNKYIPKPVVQCKKNTYEVLSEFRNSKEAADFIGVDRSCIVKCCSHKQKTSRGYSWFFKDELKNRIE